MAASASDAHPFPIYNARYRAIFPLLDADGDLVTGASTPDSEISQDCGTFADATNEMTEIATSSGMYYLDLVAGEMDTKSTAVIAKSATAGMKTTPLVLYPVRLPVIRTGTAQAGAASTITLDSGASAITDYYVGCYVNITNNSPANAQGQARKITAYNGSTKVATVEGTYGTNPSSASTFEILATEDWIYRFGDVLAFGGVAATSASGRPEVNTTLIEGSDATNQIRDAVVDDATRIDASALNTASGAVGSNGSGLTEAGGTGDQFTAVPWNAAWDAEVQSEVQDALEVNHLDHLLAVDYDPASKPGVATALLNELVESDAGVSRYTANALEQAPTGGGASAATIADAVWDEAMADHTTAGTFGAGVDSLLTRITSTLFSGITSMAQWLGMLAGKQSGNATARTEIRATGAGSGTFDETTDSQEAIRDRVDTRTTDIETDTQDIQSRLPAALVGGRMDANVGAISGDSVAADNAEAAFDGTGYNVGAGQVVAASVTGAVGSVTGNVGGNVVGSVGSLAAQAKADVNAEVLDVIATDTHAEPASVPAATSSIKDKLGWMFVLSRNKITQTATTQLVRNDADSATIGTSTVSDDNITATRGEFS